MLQLDGNVDVYMVECNRMLDYSSIWDIKICYSTWLNISDFKTEEVPSHSFLTTMLA
jgi:hypothetical protein